MAAVAEGHVPGMLAGTPGDCFFLRDLHFPWLQSSAFVGAVAKGLTFGTPTSAPPIDSGFHQLDDGRFLKNYRLIHVSVYTGISRQATQVYTQAEGPGRCGSRIRRDEQQRREVREDCPSRS